MQFNNKKLWKQILLICILLGFNIFSLLMFTEGNNKRIVEQNDSYLTDATKLVSKRVDDVMKRAEKSISALAFLYGKTLSSPDVEPEVLTELADKAPFEYVELISADGKHIDSQGELEDVSGQEFYMEGMKGNTGSDVMTRDGKTAVLFYTPLYYGDEIVGVMNGSYGNELLDELLTTSFFDVQTRTYLCKPDGTVIYACGVKQKPDNILKTLAENINISDEAMEQVRLAFENHETRTYTYSGTRGTGNACVTELSNDWMLLQTFPSTVNSLMIDTADRAGIQLEIKLIVGFLIYIMFILFLNRKLESEKKEMSRIVGAVTQLFNRFVVVDFENDTYEYMETVDAGISQKGSYTDLIQYMTPKYIREEGTEDVDLVIHKDYIQKHMDKDTPYLQCEYRIDWGGERWENISILCLKREEEVPAVVLMAVQDVTALKKKEAQTRLALKNAFEAAEEANRAKSDFLSRMSHDIRTPMNAIMGMTAVAAMHVDDHDRLLDCLHKITVSSRHLLALINDVLDMSKIESGKVTLSEEAFNMAELVENLLTIIRPQITAKRQHLKVNISHIIHEDVIGDTLRLSQVFVNIMGNAVKFTPEEGEISFGISETASLIKGQGCYEFVFEDNGIGMEPDYIDNIFEPFTRSNASTTKKIEGTGLGMPIARNIVRMMNGTIKVESELGKGSKFTVQIYLPLQNVEKEDVTSLADLEILVADDDQDACVATCEILDSIGMDASWVLSGGEAVEKVVSAHERNEEYAAIILDWKMPGKSGVETAREIREKVGSDVPIIILSAYDWSEIEQEARDAGVDAFIEKPLFRSRLINVLKALVETGTDVKKTSIDGFQEEDYSGRRVLLVEDNELNREIAGELLESIGINVEMAVDGQQAVDILKEKPEDYFDLVFMDIQMPVMNGYEAARAIRGSGRADLEKIPIVAMSADAFSDDIRKAKEAGMDDHVAKPVEFDKLSAALEKWLM